MTDIMLSTHKMNKNFGALIANQDVSIDLCAGEIHAIIGPNGAGKSTLIAQICGTLRPSSGKIEFLGQDITQHSVQERSLLGIGRSFQISALAMEDTVLQNAMLGALGATGNPWHFISPALKNTSLREIAEQALMRVGLEDVSHMRTAELSHGQRRQLEIAMTLTLKPKAFIMDEPMAGLGSEGSKDLTEFLDRLRHEAPILLVEHDMDAVFALADRISVLVYGKVIATGTVEEIRNHADVQHAYLGEGG